MKYNIVLADNKDFILASCNSKEFAEKYLKNMKQTDKQLKNYYGWKQLPEYLIIETKDESKYKYINK